MPPTRPERYNANARRSSVGGSSHKKKRRVKVKPTDDQDLDPNAEILVPKSKEHKEQTRRDFLRQQACPIIIIILKKFFGRDDLPYPPA